MSIVENIPGIFQKSASSNTLLFHVLSSLHCPRTTSTWPFYISETKRNCRGLSLVSWEGDLALWLNYRSENFRQSLINLQVHCHDTTALHHQHTNLVTLDAHDTSVLNNLHIGSTVCCLSLRNKFMVGNTTNVLIKRAAWFWFLIGFFDFLYFWFCDFSSMLYSCNLDLSALMILWRKLEVSIEFFQHLVLLCF